MATFKDIAQRAGVSYGTVSNVMNNRGNVSSDKVQRVQDAARQLGYTANLDAKSLRKGNSDVLSVIMPNILDTQYDDFYLSFRNYAEAAGYRVTLTLHDGDPGREQTLLLQNRAIHPAGTAVISSFSGSVNHYLEADYSADEMIFAEQRPFDGYDYVGFDYRRIGQEMGKRAARYHYATLLTEAEDQYVSKEIASGFLQETSRFPECVVQRFCKESAVRSATLALDILSANPVPEAVFTVRYSQAETIDNVRRRFFPDKKTDLYTISHLFTMPEVSYAKFELNYRLLGKVTAEQLINRIEGRAEPYFRNILLAETGFRSWNPGAVPEAAELNILTLDSPTAYIMRHMASLYRGYTGVNVRIDIAPYDDIHHLLSGLDENSSFDIIRLDATWMSYFAPKIYEPLAHLEGNLRELQTRFLPDLMDRYGKVQGCLYALPESPSTQMLFYRKDLFEDTATRRLYQEKTGRSLCPPRTFEDYNRIAAFFTRDINPFSPVKYGSTMTLGNTGTAATEFLTRYFALNHELFDLSDHILINTPEGAQALRELVTCSHYVDRSSGNWWRDTARGFAAGNTAMALIYSNYASEIVNRDSAVRGRIGYAMLPGENPMFGGGSIGVSRFSRHKELAYHFIRWLCGEQVSSAMTLLGSVSPCRNTYQNYHIIDNYPWLSMTASCFEKTDARRLPHQTDVPFDERRFLDILGRAVLYAIDGYCSVEEALENAETSYNNR